jgi:signal transduction histidine kinase
MTLARQVNQLLHLAEASETQNYVFESVDVGAVTEDVVDYLRRLAELRKVYVDIRGAAAARIDAHGTYNPAESHVRPDPVEVSRSLS